MIMNHVKSRSEVLTDKNERTKKLNFLLTFAENLFCKLLYFCCCFFYIIKWVTMRNQKTQIVFKFLLKVNNPIARVEKL